MLEFDVNMQSVEQSNLFLRKLWCELECVRESGWSFYPYREKGKKKVVLGMSNIGEISFDYKKTGCIRKLYIDNDKEKERKQIEIAVKNALKNDFKKFTIWIKLKCDSRELIEDIHTDNVRNFTDKCGDNVLIFTISAYSAKDAEHIVKMNYWTIQSILLEYTHENFEIESGKIWEGTMEPLEVRNLGTDYDYEWIDRSDIPRNPNGKIVIPEECLLVIYDVFQNYYITDATEKRALILNSARILYTGYALERKIEFANVPGISDVINTTIVSSLEPLAVFLDHRTSICDKCGAYNFSVVHKMKELITKYFDADFADEYCKRYYSGRSKLLHEGETQSIFAMYGHIYPLIDVENPQNMLGPFAIVDPQLLDWSSYVFRNFVHEYYNEGVVLIEKNGEEKVVRRK